MEGSTLSACVGGHADNVVSVVQWYGVGIEESRFDIQLQHVCSVFGQCSACALLSTG